MSNLGQRRLSPSVVVGFLLCLLSALIQFSVVRGTTVDHPIRADAQKYVAYAYNLRHAGTFSHQPPWEVHGAPIPDKLTLPGYPLFLSLFLNDFPDHEFQRRVTGAQAVLGVASTLLTFLIALRLVPLGWAAAAAVIQAINPHFATISTYLLTEALFTTLLLASVWAMLKATAPNARVGWWIAAGLLVGLASLVRPQLQLLPWLALAGALVYRRWRPTLPRVVLALSLFLAVMAPWHLRNAVTPRAPGDGDLLTATLHHGSYPNMTYEGDPRSYGYPYRFDPLVAEHSRDLPTVVAYIARQFRDHPVRYASWYLAGKPGFFLSWSLAGEDVFIYPVQASPYQSSQVFAALRGIAFALHWPLMLLALSAAFLAPWKPHLFGGRVPQAAAVALAALFLYAIAMHVIGAPYPRYGIPFRPLAFVLAISLLHVILVWARARTRVGMPPTPMT